MDFDISFEKTLQDLAQVTQRLSGIGRELDEAENKGQRLSGNFTKAFSRISSMVGQLETALHKLGAEESQVSAISAGLEKQAYKAMQSLATGGVKAATEVEALRGSMGRLGEAVQSTYNQMAEARTLKQIGALYQEQSNQLALLTAKLEALSSAEAKEVAQVEAQIRAKKQQLKSEADAAIAKTQSADASKRVAAAEKDEAEQRERAARIASNYTAIINQLEAAERELALTGEKVAFGLRQITAQEAEMMATQQRAKAIVEGLNKARVESYGTTARMTAEEARLTAQGEKLAKETKAYNDTLLEQERSSLGLGKAQKELNDQYAQQQARLDKLKAEMAYLNSERGKEEALLKRQIREQQEYNQRLTMTTAELLGFSRAQARANAEMAAGSQLTAAYRAGLAGMRSTFGMFTSSTILAASAAYALTSGVRDTILIGTEFTSTMSRVDAIMFAAAGSMAEAAEQMKSVEDMVRLMGQTTIFSANEAAEGMMELGMAGLSSSQAIVALGPSLQLASIGMISMGEAADVATNVMSMFGIEASGLQEVVDTMATAVTSSNTTISQMATALSYVGPAAATAGYSLKDVTAALETLANSGVKSFKAGTGLRRLMMTLSAPTEKAAEMLQKYGIAVTDMDGNTRTLTDVLGQLHDALYNDGITPSERLAAVTNLVGVEASSATAALISQADALKIYRTELDNVSGAAKNMQEAIQDNLGGDWEELTSALNEVSLKAFDQVVPKLREFTSEITLVLNKIDEADVTEFIEDLQNIADIALKIGVAFGTWKGIQIVGSVAGGISDGAALLGKYADNLNLVLERNRAYQRSMEASSMATSTYSGRQAIFNATMMGTARSAEAATAATLGFTKAAKAGLSVLSVLSRFAGLAGVAYMAYEAYEMVFGGDTTDLIADQNEVLEGTTERYKEINEQLEQLANQKSIEVLTKQAEKAADQVAQLEKVAEGYRIAIESATASGGDTAMLEASLAIVTQRLEGLRDLQEDITSKQRDANSVGDEANRITESRDANAASLAEKTRKLAQEQETLNRLQDQSISLGTESYLAISEQASVVGDLEREIDGLNQTLADQDEKLRTTTGSIENYVQAIMGIYTTAQAKSFDPDLTAVEELQRAIKSRDELLDKYLQAQSADNVGSDRIARYQKEADEAQEAVNKAQKKVDDAQRKLTEARADRSRVGHENDLAYLNREIEQKRAELAEVESNTTDSGQIVDLERAGRLTKDLQQLEQQRYQASKQNGKLAVDYTAELEKQRQAQIKIADAQRDYSAYIATKDEELKTQQALNNLLYASSLTEQQRATYFDTYVTGYSEFQTLLDRTAQRQLEITRQQQQADELQARAQTETGKNRKRAEEGVSEALETQAKLVAKQYEDYQKLFDLAAERQGDLLSLVGNEQKTRELLRLREAAAQQGVYINDQEAERLLTVKEENLNYQRQQQHLNALRAELALLYVDGKVTDQVKADALRKQILMWEENQELQQQYLDFLSQGTVVLSDQAAQVQAYAEALASYFEQTGTTIRDFMADGFDDVDSFFDDIFDSFKTLLADMAYQAFVNPILIGIQTDVTNALGLGGGIGGMVPGSTTGSWQNTLQGAQTAAKGYQWLMGGGSGIGASGSAAVGYGGAGFGSQVGTGTYGGWAGNASSAAASSGSGWGSLASNAGTAAMYAGAYYGGGYLGSNVGSHLFNKQANSSYGQQIGTAAGAYFGGVPGAFVGSTLGSMVDSAFGSGRQYKAGFVQTANTPTGPVDERYYDSGNTDGLMGGRQTAFGSYGFTFKEKVEPKDMVELLDAMESFDNTLAAVMDPAEIAAVKSSLDGFKSRIKNDPLSDIFNDRLDVIVGAVNTSFDDLLKGVDPETKVQRLVASLQVDNITDGLASAVVEDVNDSFRDAVEGGADLEDVVTSITNAVVSLQQFSATAESLGLTFDDTSAGALKAAANIASLAGGMDNLTSLQQSYLEAYYTEDEQRAITIKNLTQQIHAFNEATGNSIQDKGGLRDLVDSLDLMTESGQKTYVAAMSIAGAFDQLEQVSTAAMDALSEKFDALMSDAQSAYDSAQQAAQQALSAFNSKAYDQRIELLTLMGKSEEVLAIQRAKELETIDEALRPTQERIWQLQDEQAALADATEASSKYIDALAKAKSDLSGVFGDINAWISGEKASSGTPAQQLGASKDNFYAQLSLAQAGDRDALNSITDYAQSYLDAGDSYYGSGTGSQDIRDKVLELLGNLPDQVSAEEYIAEEIKKALLEQTDSITTKLAGVLTSDNPSSIADSLANYFEALTGSVDGVLTEDQLQLVMNGKATDEQIAAMMQLMDLNNDEVVSGFEAVVVKSMPTDARLATVLSNALEANGKKNLTVSDVKAALKGIATDDQIASLIKSVDTNGDGLLSEQEITNSRLGGLSKGIANALDPLFGNIDTSLDNLIDYGEFGKYFSGLASDEKLKQIFDQLDLNGDGTISALEAVKGSTDKVDGNTKTLEERAFDQLKELTDITSEMARTTDQFVGLNGTMTSLRDAMKALGVTQAEMARIEKQRQEVEAAQKQRIDLERTLSDLESTLKGLDSKIGSSQSQVSSLKNDKALYDYGVSQNKKAEANWDDMDQTYKGYKGYVGDENAWWEDGKLQGSGNSVEQHNVKELWNSLADYIALFNKATGKGDKTQLALDETDMYGDGDSRNNFEIEYGGKTYHVYGVTSADVAWDKIQGALNSFYGTDFDWRDGNPASDLKKAQAKLDELLKDKNSTQSDIKDLQEQIAALKKIEQSVNGSHANGLDYVPFDGYQATLHRGERVLTAAQNRNQDSQAAVNQANAEMLAELRAQNKHLAASVRVMQAGFKRLIDNGTIQQQHLEDISADSRLGKLASEANR